jgi:hypothetical protein
MGKKEYEMINRSFMRRGSQIFVALAFIFYSAMAGAAQIYWTDWTGSNSGAVNGFFQGQGTITTPTSTVNVTYTNAQGIGFYQANPGTDWWTPRTPVELSPYTSTQVDNPPTFTDIVGLQFAGNQTLQFSQTIANPVFSYVSLNGNGYAFLNQDFDILSYGGAGGNLSGDNNCGYWGCGTSYKSIVDLGNGNIEYQLLGTGEPHGTIRFKGAFDTLTWRSLSNEYWNGFTVGVQGTAEEVFPPTGVPEPTSMLLLGLGLIGLAGTKRKFKK